MLSFFALRCFSKPMSVSLLNLRTGVLGDTNLMNALYLPRVETWVLSLVVVYSIIMSKASATVTSLLLMSSLSSATSSEHVSPSVYSSEYSLSMYLLMTLRSLALSMFASGLCVTCPLRNWRSESMMTSVTIYLVSELCATAMRILCLPSFSALAGTITNESCAIFLMIFGQ